MIHQPSLSEKLSPSRSANTILWILPIWLLVSLCLVACTSQPVPTSTPTSTLDSPALYSIEIVNVYPHDPQAFTQGLAFRDGYLYESTGLRGQSTLRKVDLESGEVGQMVALRPDLFGEGIALTENNIYQLTLTSGKALLYDLQSFIEIGAFDFTPEGWGLTYDGDKLVMSDGSAQLRFFDPESFRKTSQITVSDGELPVQWLNELEFVEGEIYANIWQSDRIARISPSSGEVVGWIDLSELKDHISEGGVLNGIAYDPDGKRLFVTGKNWPSLFEIELIKD